MKSVSCDVCGRKLKVIRLASQEFTMAEPDEQTPHPKAENRFRVFEAACPDHGLRQIREPANHLTLPKQVTRLIRANRIEAKKAKRRSQSNDGGHISAKTRRSHTKPASSQTKRSPLTS
jgi:hypothetical protein